MRRTHTCLPVVKARDDLSLELEELPPSQQRAEDPERQSLDDLVVLIPATDRHSRGTGQYIILVGL